MSHISFFRISCTLYIVSFLFFGMAAMSIPQTHHRQKPHKGVESLKELCFQVFKNRVNVHLGRSYASSFEHFLEECAYFKRFHAELREEFGKYYAGKYVIGPEKWKKAEGSRDFSGGPQIVLQDGGVAHGVGNQLCVVDAEGNDTVLSGDVQDRPWRHQVSHVWELKPGIIISTNHRGIIKLWNLEKRACTTFNESHGNYVNDVCLLSENSFATASDDRTIKIWDLSSCQCLRTLETEGNASILEYRDGFLISVSDNAIQKWCLQTFACLQNIPGDFRGRLFTLLPECRMAIVTRKDGDSWYSNKIGIISIFDMSTGTMLHQMESEGITGLCVLKDGTLASLGEFSTLRIWDMNTMTCIQKFEWGDTCATSNLVQLADGRLSFTCKNGNYELFFAPESGWGLIERIFKDLQKRKKRGCSPGDEYHDST